MPKREFKNEFITVVIDPLDKFPDLSEKQIMEICGLIPYWILTPEHINLSIKEILEIEYKWGMNYFDKGEIGRDGTFYYPEDPPIYPLILMKREKEILYQYESGMVSFTDNGHKYITRMD